MSVKTPKHTYKVTCELPPSVSRGEIERRVMVSYIYDHKNQTTARQSWFRKFLPTARVNGLRGDKKSLKKSLKLTIERVKV